ncbi:hypothetical protein [Roseibium album]|uniref:hypothetical protein n=1 Tax=Roseibium album TaxID=311410 RepID=UPI0024929FA5|nr:hypothetical protein [Roseibium album]
MLSIFPIYALPLFPATYAPFLMPNWRWFLLLCIAYGAMGLGVRYGVANYASTDVHRSLVVAGNIWLDLVLPLLPFTLLPRGFVLAAKSLGLRGWKLFGLNLIGILALPTFFIGASLIDRWERRPAPIACISRPLPIDLAGISGTIPWSKAIRLYLGANTRSDARYLFSPSSKRKICSQTNDGRRPLSVKAIKTSLFGRDRARCMMDKISQWEESVCEKTSNRNSSFYLVDVVFFQPDGIKLGDFGIRNIRIDGSLIARSDEQIFSTDDGTFGRVEFVCRQQSSEFRFYCTSRFRLTDLIDVHLEMGSTIVDINKNMEKALLLSKTMCVGIFDQPPC